jgi:glycerophosphoryl diester phosphodiesterase
MKYLKLRTSLCLVLLLLGMAVQAQEPREKLLRIINETNKTILIAAHRGDWRNTPENSMKALLNCIERGYDIMELDVKMTRDSQLVIMHDNTIDRTTNAKGKVSDYTLAEIRKLRLRNGLGRVTGHPIPTLEEMMLAAKDKIIINVDKGNDWLPAVLQVLQKTGTLEQSIVNVGDNIAYQQLIKENDISDKAILMVVADMKLPDAAAIISSYKTRKRSIIQPIFNTDSLTNLNTLPKVSSEQVIWLNGLWPSLNGGHDDDLAVEQADPEAAWGWLISKGASILQTDRPLELQKYLREKKMN